MKRRLCLLSLILALLAVFFVVMTPKTASEEITLPEANNASQEVTTIEPIEVIETPEPIVLKPLPKVMEGQTWTIPEGLDPKTHQMLIELIDCESTGNANALNKVDRDGTSSYGLLQFKPSTFHGAVKLIHPEMSYDEAFNAIYDGNLQIRAFLAWYGEGKPIAWWKQQFPACSAKYGYWLE